MADVDLLIPHGLLAGTDIEHFLLLGFGAGAAVAPVTPLTDTRGVGGGAGMGGIGRRSRVYTPPRPAIATVWRLAPTPALQASTSQAAIRWQIPVAGTANAAALAYGLAHWAQPLTADEARQPLVALASMSVHYDGEAYWKAQYWRAKATQLGDELDEAELILIGAFR